jgi:hypothetical protein
MKRLATLLFIAICGFAAAEVQSPSQSATALVRAMRLDELAATIANEHAHRKATKGRTTRKPPGCLVTLRPASLTDDLARAVADLLSPVEIESAATFYATSAGAKVTDHTFRQVEYQLAGGTDTLPPPATTPEEDFTFDAFAKTAAGKRFVENGFLLNTSQVEGVISTGVRNALVRCRPTDDASSRGEIVPRKQESPLEREPQSD